MKKGEEVILKYNRVLLKFSGEALRKNGGSRAWDIDQMVILAFEIRNAISKFPMLELCLMPGGGNHGRGSEITRELRTTLEDGTEVFVKPSTAHVVGMLNTIKNTIVFEDILGQVLAGIGREVRSMTAIEMDQVTEEYKLKRAEKQLRNGRVLIFGAGSGRTHFSTDLAAANRAAELGCDLFLKGTKVKGIFSKDPKDADAEFLGHLTPQDFIARGLDTIVDADGVTHAGKQGIPARVFNIFESGNLARILAGEDIGTAISIKQQDARS